MSSLRFWALLLFWTLPALVLAVGLFPPHVIPPLGAPLALAGLLLVLALAGSGRLRSPRPGVAFPLLAACFVAALSAAMSYQPMLSVRSLTGWLAGGIVFAAARSAMNETEARRVTASIVILAALLGARGLYQSVVAFPAASATGDVAEAVREAPEAGGKAGDLGEAEEARLRSGRAVGTLGLPAALASILILGLPIATARAIGSEGIRRTAWGAAALVQVLALGATQSIGGAAALAAAVLLCIPSWSDVSAPRRRLVIASILLAGGLLAAPRLLVRGEGSALLSATQRSANWKAGLSMVVSHPLLGVGPGNYGVAFPQHRTWASNETKHAHNSYLEAVSDLGLPILPLLLVALAALIAWTRAIEDPVAMDDAGTRRIRRGLSVGCLAWSVQNLFDFTAYLNASAIPFLAAAGLLARSAAGLPGSGAASGTRDGEPGAPGPRAGIVTRSLLLAASALAVLVAIPDAVSRIRLDRAVDSAARLDFEGAVADARLASVINPFDPEARVVLSQSLIDAALHRPAGDAERGRFLDEALVEAEEAVRLDPQTANRRGALAMARAAAGDVAGAYASMAAAARLNPFKPSYAEERDRLLLILTGQAPAGAGTGGGTR